MKVRHTLAAVAALALFAACAGETSAQARPKSEALPLTAHVVDALPGFTASGTAQLLSREEFAEQHDKSVADLEKAGVLGASVQEFVPDDEAPGMAMSIAVQYRSTAAAEKEATRLFASNSAAEDGTTVTPVDVPGIPGARAVQLDGEMDEQQVRGLEVVFVEEKVVHELFAFTLSSGISVADLIAAVSEMYTEVQGRRVR